MPAGIVSNGIMFFLAIAGQVVGASLLPATRGFTHAGFTAGCLGAFAIVSLRSSPYMDLLISRLSDHGFMELVLVR